MSAVELKDVYKSYSLAKGRRTRSLLQLGREQSSTSSMVLRRVNAVIPAGTATGIVGDNGAGKSTLLRIMAGVTAPSRGEVTRSVSATGLMNLGSGVLGVLTGRENAITIAMLSGASKERAMAMLPDIESYAQLGKAFDQPLRTYSAGMRMRLVFSSLVHARPQLLLLDEVLSVGDRWFRPQCRETVADLCRDGNMTVILTSHEPAAVRELCQNALWLDQGRVVASGATATVMDAYESASAPIERRSRSIPKGLPSASARTAEIADVTYTNGSGVSVASITAEDRFDIRFRLDAESSLHDCVFHLGLIDMDARPVYKTTSIGSDIDGEAFEPGAQVVVSFERIGLPPGDYDLSLTLFTADWSTQIAVRYRLDPFEVVPSNRIADRGSPRRRPSWRVVDSHSSNVAERNASPVFIMGERFTGAEQLLGLLRQYSAFAAVDVADIGQDILKVLLRTRAKGADRRPMLSLDIETQFDVADAVPKLIVGFPAATFIVVVRTNLLAQYVDAKTAEKSGGRLRSRGQVQVNASEFKAYCDESRRRYSELLSTLASHGARESW